MKLWNFDKYYQFIGASGGYGIGYGAPVRGRPRLSPTKNTARISVNIQCDGDLMYAPGSSVDRRRTIASPLLTLMHNNRAYHQEVMQVQIMADRHKPRHRPP